MSRVLSNPKSLLAAGRYEFEARLIILSSARPSDIPIDVTCATDPPVMTDPSINSG